MEGLRVTRFYGMPGELPEGDAGEGDEDNHSPPLARGAGRILGRTGHGSIGVGTGSEPPCGGVGEGTRERIRRTTLPMARESSLPPPIARVSPSPRWYSSIGCRSHPRRWPGGRPALPARPTRHSHPVPFPHSTRQPFHNAVAQSGLIPRPGSFRVGNGRRRHPSRRAEMDEAGRATLLARARQRTGRKGKEEIRRLKWPCGYAKSH